MRYHSKESDRGRLKGKKSCMLIAVLMVAVSSFAAKGIVMFVGAHPVEYAETYTTFNGERYPGGVLKKCQASFQSRVRYCGNGKCDFVQKTGMAV